MKNAHPEAETQVPIKPMDANGNAMRSGGNYLDGIALTLKEIYLLLNINKVRLHHILKTKVRTVLLMVS